MHAARHARRAARICDLVLLVGPVAAVDAGRRGQPVARGSRCSWAKTIIGLTPAPNGPKPRTSRASEAAMDDNLHSLPRRLIELRIEHADLDSLIDRAAVDVAGDDLVVASPEEAPPAAARPDRAHRSRARSAASRHEPARADAACRRRERCDAERCSARARARRSADGGALAASRSASTPSARCSCEMARAVAAGDRGAQRAGGRGRHRRRQDLRLPGAGAAVAARARWSAPPPRRLQDQLFLRDLPRLRDALQRAGDGRAAEGPLELPVPAPAAARRARTRSLPDRFAVRALARDRGMGADDARAATSPSSRGSTSAAASIPLVTSSRENCLGSECPRVPRMPRR